MSSRLLQALPALCLAMLVGLAPAMAQTDQGDKAKQQAAEQAKREAQRLNDLAEVSKQMTGPAGNPECVWIGRRVVHYGGAALIVDYGHVKSAIGDTLQAVSGHAFADPLLRPGAVDLTAHVDFQALAEAAAGMGARVHGPVTQAAFLRTLGIEQRAGALETAAPAEHAGAIRAALQRLTSEEHTGMGSLIKVLALSDPRIESLPGLTL